ncbi:MAG: VCBS repeat-containing protein [Acidimicrobiia bacterium]
MSDLCGVGDANDLCRVRRRQWRLWLGYSSIVALGIGVGACGGDDIDPRALGADPGRTVEPQYEWSASDGELPPLTDVTVAWGLDGFENTAEFQAAGGVALGDLDGDGWIDMAVAGGDLTLFYGGDDGMTPAATTIAAAIGEVASVGLADVDGDGMLDVLIGVIGGDDLIVWGGGWSATRDPSSALTTPLPGGTQTVALMAADLGGDERADVLRLSHDPSEPDFVWVQVGSRVFAPEPLPLSYRQSFAAEIVDVDGDGLLDIWVTRDIGWSAGADSIYTRQGDPEGPWIDIAPEVGTALAVDGMGIALADLDGDGTLDAYVTDIGENDILLGGTDRYRPAVDTGAGRIRPPGAPLATVSSSWAVGAADINLDGTVDLVVANGGFGGADIVNKVPGTEIVDLDTPSVFLGLGDGRFADVWPRLNQPWRARIRGMALGDLDRDGDADLVFVSNAGGIRVYRNDVRGQSVTLVVPEPACAAGFIATVKGPSRSYRAVLTQHSFLGAHGSQLTVGTGGAAVEISVTRPGRTPFTREISAGSGRMTIEVPCR